MTDAIDKLAFRIELRIKANNAAMNQIESEEEIRTGREAWLEAH